MDVDVCSPVLEDHDEFLTQYEPVINEYGLMPPQISFVRKIFGRTSIKVSKAIPGLPSLTVSNYSNLTSSFLNMDNEQREFIATNFYNLDESLREFLIS